MMKADFEPFALAARKYRNHPGSPERVYRALCYVLSDRAGQVDWDAFTADDWRIFKPMAEAEGVAPLVWWKLRGWTTDDGRQTTDNGRRTTDDGRRATGDGRRATDDRRWTTVTPNPLPPHLLTSLAESYYATLARNTLLLQELERILPAFERAKIPVIVLKGAALAQTVYEDIGLRPMSDLDLLVRPGDALQAQSVLGELGYRPTTPEIFKGFNRQFGSHVHLSNAGIADVYVELHWHLFSGQWDRREPSAAWFWESSKPVESPGGVAEATVRIMSAEAALLYLSAHLTLKHGGDWGRLLWFYDLYLLIQAGRDSIRWNIVFEQAEAFHWAQSLEEALLQSDRRFDIHLPEGVMARLQFSEKNETTPLRQPVIVPALHTLNTWDFLGYMHWKARLHLIFGLAFPSPAYVRWRYRPRPDWIWPLYYPYRWGTLLRDNWRALNAQRKRI